MTALSFFSYKGGVGRTMALTNLAMRLVEFGKSVFIIDFDLEAPGVPFKLERYISPDKIETGVVDYIHEFTANGKIDSLKKYVKELPKNNPGDAPMWLMPAGNANLDEYWNKLSRINWHSLFYTEGGKGLRFFLDLKEKIRKEYNPDFILIDSRTGISELSGISLKILADEVVVLFINNEENIKGTEKVLSFIYNDTKNIDEQLSNLHLVLTRVPHHHNDSIKFNQEYKLLSHIKSRFSQKLQTAFPEINVIHTDARLQMNENLAFERGKKVDENSSDIYSEHITLFEKLFIGKFSQEEWDKNQNAIKASEIFQEAIFETNNLYGKIKLLSEAIKLNNQKWEYFYYRGDAYEYLYNFEKAAEDFKISYEISRNPNRVIDLARTLIYLKKYAEALVFINNVFDTKDNNEFAIGLKAIILKRMGDYTQALEILNNSIEIHQNSDILLSQRADLFRVMKQPYNGLKDIFKALELLPAFGTYHAELAALYSDMRRDEEFYMSLNTALSLNVNIMLIRSLNDAFQKFRKDIRFIKLFKSYNIDSEDIFHDGPPKNINLNISDDGDDDGDIVPQSIS
jgi:tetratricopeptide (TPR) repeat protein